MEETKELQTAYKIFRTLIYVSLVVEFFEYAIDPELLDYWGGIVCDVHDRMKRWFIYHDGNLVWSKLATILCICITCIGTRNKKHIEFDARRQVLYPLVGGFIVTLVSIWLFKTRMDTRFYTIALNVWLYMAASILGTILIHVALDNISKFLKEGLLKDRFNFENESFQQCEELIENKYSVNIPMRYYYKSKFRKGWVNIVNPFRGTWVVGTPGSGKTFSIIEPFIRQHSAKGFAMVVYDYKFPTLATKLYYHYRKNLAAGKVPKGCKFNMSAAKLHRKYQEVLESLDLPKELCELYQERLTKMIKEGNEEGVQQATILRRQRTETEKKINVCKTRYALGEIESEVYLPALTNLEDKLKEIDAELEKYVGILSNYQNKLDKISLICSNTSSYWKTSDLETRKRIQKLAFPDGIFYDREKGNYRTSNKNVIYDIINKLSGCYEQKEGEKPSDFSPSVKLCAG